MNTKNKSSEKVLSEPLQQCNVSSSAYNDLAKFINKSHERRFNDALMKLVIVEIKLKSFDFNENIILPTCRKWIKLLINWDILSPLKRLCTSLYGFIC